MGMTFYPGLTLAGMLKIMTIYSLKLIWIETSILRCYMEDELCKEDRKGYWLSTHLHPHLWKLVLCYFP